MQYVTAKGILSAKNGMNLYRGCSHGCIYCDSRSNCYHMEHGKERPVYFDARTKIHLKNYLDSRTDENPALFVSDAPL